METQLKIGFTGTQRGMTPDQKAAVRNLLWEVGGGEFHHGDCIGADAEAHDIAVSLRFDTVIHPPSDPSKRAFKWATARTHYIRTPKPYLERNHDIVDETQEMIATPGEYHEQLRSGTWATVRYARKLKRKITIIFPDGSLG